MTVEKTEQSRMIKGYEVTVAVNHPDFWQLDEIDKEIIDVLDHIEETMECLAEARS